MGTDVHIHKTMTHVQIIMVTAGSKNPWKTMRKNASQNWSFIVISLF